jgi:hypothetical protein
MLDDSKQTSVLVFAHSGLIRVISSEDTKGENSVH